MTVLTVRHLGIAWNHTAVVRDVSFAIARGEGLALVGPSGAGKSSIALAIGGLLPATARVTGDVTCVGTIGYAFQDVGSCLNPVMRIGHQVAETVTEARGREAMHDAGVADPVALWHRYPHELSGGQRQRVMLAIALAHEPALLIADEPTTALDPTLRLALLDRLATLRRERGLALLLITHDLRAARRAADRVAVLDEGMIVESGPVNRVLDTPTSARTVALVNAMPRLPEPA